MREQAHGSSSRGGVHTNQWRRISRNSLLNSATKSWVGPSAYLRTQPRWGCHYLGAEMRPQPGSLSLPLQKLAAWPPQAASIFSCAAVAPPPVPLQATHPGTRAHLLRARGSSPASLAAVSCGASSASTLARPCSVAAKAAAKAATEVKVHAPWPAQYCCWSCGGVGA